MKKRSVALYDPFLDTLGGGEKHILQILKVLEDKEYEINIFWNKNLQQSIEQRFSLRFINKISWLPNIFQSPGNIIGKLMILSKFDIFFYVTDGSYFFSTAKKNFSFCMVPQASLYKMTLMNKFKMLNYKFIANSNFTKYWLNKWNIHAKVIYPFINKDLIDLEVNKINKDKIILTVGRFFSHLHSKRQSEIIKLFTKLKQKYPMFKDFKLIITGGLKKQDEAYFNQLKLLTVNNPDIYLHANPSYEYLINLYKKSLIYLHFTGYGLEEKKHPDQVEHLGISPLEAMTCGCITFCYNAGGPKELIKNGRNGFLFNSEKELIKQVQMVLTNIALQKNIQIDAKKYITKNFSYAVFTERVRKEILSQ